LLIGALAVALLVALARDAGAEPAGRESSGSPGPRGLVVLAEGSSVAPAWALARVIYGDPGLLPPGLDEARARVLVGESPATDAPKAVQDLAETRGAIHGDDAPSRSLLVAIASSLHAKGVLVVTLDEAQKPSARVFVATSGAFDAVVYQPDASAPTAPVTWGSAAPIVTWTSAANALHRGFADASASAPPVTPALTQGGTPAPSATQTGIAPTDGEKPKGSRPFYTSPWFWGAIGAAAFAGLAFFFATRDSSDPNIQLQVQVPK
jgi:hypothetical protein